MRAFRWQAEGRHLVVGGGGGSGLGDVALRVLDPDGVGPRGIDAGQNPLTVWNSNPIPTMFLFLAAYLYLTGLSRWDRPTHPVTGGKGHHSLPGCSFFFWLSNRR